MTRTVKNNYGQNKKPEQSIQACTEIIVSLNISRISFFLEIDMLIMITLQLLKLQNLKKASFRTSVHQPYQFLQVKIEIVFP